MQLIYHMYWHSAQLPVYLRARQLLSVLPISKKFATFNNNAEKILENVNVF